MEHLKERLRANLARVKAQIHLSAVASGRTADDILLVAVTKYVDLELTNMVFECGVTALGESRPQDLWKKAQSLADQPVKWHLIGHLQRNKVRRTLPIVTCIHSVDSIRLAEAIDEDSTKRPIDVLLEVNISGEQAKHGFRPDDLIMHIESIARCENIRVRGLMTMAGRHIDRDATRRQFSSLRELRDRLIRQVPEGIDLSELSMGMSGDFDLAIEEGATIVRVGSTLFEGIDLER